MQVLAVIALTLLVGLTGCENWDLDQYDQISFKYQEFPRIQRPVNSVSMNAPRTNYEDVDGMFLTNPYLKEKDLLVNGEKLYNIYCMPCHGFDGTTSGAPVADKFEMRPADLMNEAVLSLTEGDIFQRIVEGFGIMPSYKIDLSDKEAWEVTAHVMKLQNRN